MYRHITVVQKDPGVRLGIVAWLKCCEVTMLGEHCLEAGTYEQLPVMLRDWITTIADSCTWAIPTSLMRESFEVILLWVIIPYCINAFGATSYLGLQIWINVERHILGECWCGSHHVDNGSHI